MAMAFSRRLRSKRLEQSRITRVFAAYAFKCDFPWFKTRSNVSVGWGHILVKTSVSHLNFSAEIEERVKRTKGRKFASLEETRSTTESQIFLSLCVVSPCVTLLSARKLKCFVCSPTCEETLRWYHRDRLLTSCATCSITNKTFLLG